MHLNYISLYIMVAEDIKEKIAKVQHDNNYPSLARLTYLVLQEHPDIFASQVKSYLQEDINTQLLKKQYKKKADGHIAAKLPNERVQMDIMDLTRFRIYNAKAIGTTSHEYLYVLVCVDVFSRKAYAEQVEGKTTQDCIKAFELILQDMKPPPRSLMTDNEPAFDNQKFQNMLQTHDINLTMNALSDHNALGIVDSFIGKFKQTLAAMFLRSKYLTWIDKYKKIIEVYNKTPHSAIHDLTPNDGMKDENYSQILKINTEKEQYNHTISDLNIGDKVRKNMIKSEKFVKKTLEARWSDEIYTVAGINSYTITLDDGSKHKEIHY